MSRVFFGTYIKLKTVIKEATERVYACPDHDCVRSGNFCNLCGKELTLVDVKTQYVSSAMTNLYDMFEFAVVGNMTYLFLRNYTDDYRGGIPVTPELVKMEIKDSKDGFKSCIAQAEHLLGYKPGIQFGLVCYD